MKKIDTLPTGPDWTCEVVKAAGDHIDENGTAMEEKLELWQHDPVECIKELVGNPAFKEAITYTPERVYANSEGTECYVSFLFHFLSNMCSPCLQHMFTAHAAPLLFLV